MIAVLKHLRNTRRLEQVLELAVGQLAHQARVESPAFLADRGITEAVVGRQAFSEVGLAILCRIGSADPVPQLFFAPFFKIHLCSGVAGEPTTASESRTDILH